MKSRGFYLDTPEADELYYRMAPFSLRVKKYMNKVEKEPILRAASLKADHRLWAELKGVVLAGNETKYGYVIAAWERKHGGTGYEV